MSQRAGLQSLYRRKLPRRLSASRRRHSFGSTPHPRLREAGVLLAESRLARSEALQGRVLALADDRDDRVRFQVALSLGAWDDDRILGPLARIALSGADDRWTRLAVASAVPERAGALAVTLITRPFQLADRPDPGRLAMLRELAAVVGSRRNPQQVARVLEALLSIDANPASRWQIAGLLGLADGLGRRGDRLGTFLKGLPDSAVSDRVAAILTGTAGVATDTGRDLAERLDAIQLLSHTSWKVAGPALAQLLTDDPAREVRLAAVAALARFPESEASEAILRSWKSYLPAMRREATQALLARPEHAMALLDEVESGRIAPGDIDAAGTRRLIDHPRSEVRDRARRVLRSGTAEGRLRVLERYRAALNLDGDVDRGRAVFGKQCATCHRIDGLGVAVGPDISDLRTRTREQLLGDILDPNAAIDANYVSYTVATRDGRILSGLIASETASGVILRRAEGQTDEVLRRDIEEIRSDGVSLMPEGLEQEIDVEALADLLAFLKGWRRLGK